VEILKSNQQNEKVLIDKNKYAKRKFLNSNDKGQKTFDAKGK
jgi:hypothetical protein